MLISSYKFQVFITINSLSLYKVLYATTEIIDVFNLINKDILDFVQNNFY